MPKLDHARMRSVFVRPRFATWVRVVAARVMSETDRSVRNRLTTL